MREVTGHNHGGDLAGSTAELVGVAMPLADRAQELKPHQRELQHLYREVRKPNKGTIFLPERDRDRSDLVGAQGTLQKSFLLPNGETLGAVRSIGLPNPCRTPKLHEIRYSIEDSGYWLCFTAQNKRGEEKEVLVLLKENTAGADAIKSFLPHQKELLDLYQEARKPNKGTIFLPDCDRDRSDLVGPQGKLKESFLLPNGETLGAERCIGLPGPCRTPKLHEIRYSIDDNGYWLRFTAQNEKGKETEVLVLVREDTAGADAIKSFLPHQKELLDLYREARKPNKGTISFPDCDRDRSDLVGPRGRLQVSFLLPNGEILGAERCIGLPGPCRTPKLHEICYSVDDNGYWLRFTAQNEKGKETEVLVLVREDTAGADAIKSFLPHQKELLDLYREARKPNKGTIFLPERDRDRSDLVGPQGKLQKSFLLPNGETLGAERPIGLPNHCSTPKLHEIRYSIEDKGFWIKASVVATTSGRTKVVEFLVSDDPEAEGKNGILKNRELGQAWKSTSELPVEFRRRELEGDRRFARRSRALEEATTQVLTKSTHNCVTFVKGEAFEQLIGVALALKYLDEQIVPQYCLKVEVDTNDRGFYGMRADYRVGDDKIVEVKWGAATQNIIDTRQRHTEQLRSNDQSVQLSYELIMLEGNQELDSKGVPYTLFSALAQSLGPEFCDLVIETQALIVESVNKSDRQQLERLRDYLYSTLIDVRDGGNGAGRRIKLQSALESLILQSRDELSSFLEGNTKVYFNSLEANFEWKGQLHSDCIDPLQYYAEHPEVCEFVYTFVALMNGSFRRLCFAEPLARNLAIAQELMCNTTHEFLAEDGVIRNPVFNFGSGVLVTTQASLINARTEEGVKVVTSLSDLRDTLSATSLNKQDSEYKDYIGFVEAWSKANPFCA